MWTEFRKAANPLVAQAWKELLDAQGVPARIVVDPDSPAGEGWGPRVIYVPRAKKHVAEEVLRKV